ncbi:AAA-like domain protein [Pseudomonas saudimassiliensis]|uniref:AAA-like domain protein n=1 Tax=Pseudomonas saudimassiliensis TaxID=1461581 RepID=A0A078MIJ7_9PSED|nr:helicase HerA-like domain-containing protein [Pseudomonas saudimassiliensis]CEA04571.1 AAA-like domain protein [Pseudomonas saudimassiliensis]CEF26691.1 AAA-like domain protein [Pseudomonas saudimassiliensis]
MTNPTVPPLLLGASSEHPVAIEPRMANRHGLVAGATGTGKTITLQVMAQAFSELGVPVLVPDIKGDFSGIAQPGVISDQLQQRAIRAGIEDLQPTGAPTVFWDVYGEHGHPLRLTVADFGPVMLARLLNLNETQTGVLQVLFKVADDHGWLLLDLKDLRAMLGFINDNRSEIGPVYGNVAPASIGAIQRALLSLDNLGGEQLFGEPAITLEDLMQTNQQGQGVVNILHAARLYRDSPLAYSSILLWLLSELFEQLPEVGDADKPRFVLFFDEAHLLFKDTPKTLVDRIEQVVRLIRSKGVGVYFITQSPLDVPEAILGQLGNRVQHALRAFTPKDQQAVRTAAQTFRSNPVLDTEAAITELGVGEALVSVLDSKGVPTPVQRVLIRPPASQMGPITDQERSTLVQRSVLSGVFDQALDRESAYEVLQAQAERALSDETVVTRRQSEARERRRPAAERSVVADMVRQAGRSAMRAFGTQLGRQIMRGLLGSLKGR